MLKGICVQTHVAPAFPPASPTGHGVRQHQARILTVGRMCGRTWDCSFCPCPPASLHSSDVQISSPLTCWLGCASPTELSGCSGSAGFVEAAQLPRCQGELGHDGQRRGCAVD